MVIGHFYDKMWLVRCTNQTSNVCSVDHSVLVFLPTTEKKNWWDGIHVELQEPELELLG